VIGEIAVVDEVSVVSIGRIVLAAASDGLVLTAGFAPEDGAESAVGEKKINVVVVVVVVTVDNNECAKISLVSHPLIPLRRRR